MKKSKNKEEQQLKLLTRGNAVELPKFKRKTRLSKAGKAFVNKSPARLFDNLIFDDL